MPFERLLIVFAVALAAQAQAAGIERFELDNGLRVILRPVAGAEQVACVTLFDLGDIHDPAGQSGLGHLVEHVYVTAAAGGRPTSDALAWSTRYGGQVNAQTGRDYTVVAVVFPDDDLEAQLAEAADRMGDLRLEPADLDREIPRLVQELKNMYGGIPTLAAQNLAGEAADPLAEGARKGGVIEQVETVTVEDVRRRHRVYYKPVNATLVLAGGFDAAAVKTLVEKRFGPLDAGRPAPEPRPTGAPALGTTQRVTVPRPAFGRAPDAVATVAYRAPAPDSKLYAPFLILTARLYEHAMGDIRAAMLQQSSVVPLYYAALDVPNLLFVSSEVEPGDDEAVPSLRRMVMDRLAAGGPNAGRTFLMRQMGPMLGIIELPETAVAMNPYGAAFFPGRQAQMGIDGPTLMADLALVTEDELKRCTEEIFGPDRGAAVVVRVK